LLLAPRGEFSQGAIRIHRVRKRLYLFIYRLLGLSEKVIWHASSDREELDIRRVIGTRPTVFVRVNETSLPRVAKLPDSSSELLRLVFVGRISQKKGLDLLLRALAVVRGRLILDIYGPEEDRQYYDLCHRLAGQVAPGATVTFHHPVPHSQIRDTFSQYDAFAFPTSGENFGHVIAESLSASCPIICTGHTPWTEFILEGGGAIIPRDVSEWARTVETFAMLKPSERTFRRHLAAEAYNKWQDAPKPPHIFEMLFRPEERTIHN
jgi:glycosyltransferase involved in cell wall biosynthesis